MGASGIAVHSQCVSQIAVRASRPRAEPVAALFFVLTLALAGCSGAGSDNASTGPVGSDPIENDQPDDIDTPAPGADPSLPTSGDPVVGVIGESGAWPLVPIHMGLTPDGRVLSFGRESQDAAVMLYDVWDYRDGLSASSHLTLPNESGTDLFCANQLMLSSGVMLMTGGDTRADPGENNIGYQTGAGNADATVFDPLTNQVSRRGLMNEPRWYGTMIKLPSGEVFIQGGSTDKLVNRAFYTEIGSPDGRTFTSLRGFNVHDLPWLYPRNFVDSNGQVTGWAKRRSYRLDPTGSGARTDFGLAPQVLLEDGGLAVMYRPDKVFLAGGRSIRAITADISGPAPVYETVPVMSSPRIWGTATVLPDGRVLASNGGSNDSSAENAPLGTPAQHVSIYNPDTKTWLRGPSTQYARLYHSASILLPDATVLLGGGGLPGPVTNLNAEVYYPPYLFAEDGSFAPRPLITSAPTVLNPATRFRINVAAADSIGRVVLVKTGAVTHSFDMDQRFVELPFDRAAGSLNTRLPANPAHTTPGFYHLFVFDNAGVPSVSKIIRINPYTGVFDPPVAQGPTTSIAGPAIADDPSGYDLSCAADEVLVGVHGDADEAILALGPVCAQASAVMAQADEALIYRPAAGRMRDRNNPLAFESRCASGQAVTGFRALASERLEQFQLSCRRLDTAALLTGPVTPLGAVGNGVAATAAMCPQNTVAIGIVGSTREWTDVLTRFGLRCRAPAG